MWHVDHDDMGVRGQFAVGMSRTGVDVDIIVFEDEFPVAPALEGFEVVGAHDEAELFVAVLVAEVGKGEDGVGRYGEVEFDIAGPHTVIVVYGQTHHLEPLLVGKEGFALFEGVLGGYDIPHLVKVAMGQHGVADDEVADVDGIEGTEEKTNFSHGGGTVGG